MRDNWAFLLDTVGDGSFDAMTELPTPWELREFHLGADGGLHLAPSKQAVDPTVSFNADFQDWLAQNRDAVKAQQATVPAKYLAVTSSENCFLIPAMRTHSGSSGTAVARGMPYLKERAGLYHLSSSGQTTWYEFARAIFGEAAKPRIVPITTDQYPTPARRPAYGVLDTRKFERVFGFALPHWRAVLQSCVTSAAEPPMCPTVA